MLLENAAQANMIIETYQKYHGILEATTWVGKPAPYDWGRLPSPLCGNWLAYSQMFKEFSIELANGLNALRRHTHELTAWRDVLATMNTQEQLDAAVDFVDPLATVALNLPYVIRSRFSFSAAHLCHQANRAKQGAKWKDDFPLDNKIMRGIEDKYGEGWGTYGVFKTCLEKIDAKDYREATCDFRNAYNHRFSPRIVLGVSNLVNRQVNEETGAISYKFGATPALTLPRVVTALETQCEHAFRAFESFQQLVREHETAISALNAVCPDAIWKISKSTLF